MFCKIIYFANILDAYEEPAEDLFRYLIKVLQHL